MHFLLTNDDGIEAEGLQALTRAAAEHGDRITIVAPASEMSMIGHRVTTYEELRVDDRGFEGEIAKWAVHGTPADCTRIGLHVILADDPPDFVLSGINHGGNLGHDIYISGTVAAAREAAYQGFKAIAFSHFLKKEVPKDWESATRRVSRVLGELLEKELSDGEIWNVNLPPLPADASEPEMVEAQPERGALASSFTASEDQDGHYKYTGNYQLRPQTPGSDVAVCFNGGISLSKLSL